MEENNVNKLVTSMMKKFKEDRNIDKAETLLELEKNKERVLDEVVKVAEKLDGFQKNVDTLETKMQKNNIQTNKRFGDRIYDSLK